MNDGLASFSRILWVKCFMKRVVSSSMTSPVLNIRVDTYVYVLNHLLELSGTRVKCMGRPITLDSFYRVHLLMKGTRSLIHTCLCRFIAGNQIVTSKQVCRSNLTDSVE